MPIKGARYRAVKTKQGETVRLAWKDNKVVEAKNLTTGATHTPAQFKADEKAKKKQKKQKKTL